MGKNGKKKKSGEVSSSKPLLPSNPEGGNGSGSGKDSKESPASANNALVPRPAKQFPVKYRGNSNLTETEQKKIQKAVDDGGVAIGTHTYIGMKSLPTLLDTDRKGAAIVVDNAPKENVKELGDDTLLSTPEVIKEIAKRREEPRPALQREKLKQAQDNIEDFSDNPQLKEERAIESDRIQQDRKKIGKKTLQSRNSTTSELSGKPLVSPEVHHLDRVADQPEKARDPENLVVLDQGEHRGFHNSDFPPTKEGFAQYAEEYNKKQKSKA